MYVCKYVCTEHWIIFYQICDMIDAHICYYSQTVQRCQQCQINFD